MRIIAIKTLKEFWVKNGKKDLEQALKAWYAEVKHETWKNSAEIKRKYKNASIINKNRIVFNIKGNKYRLVVAIKYEFQIIFIRFIGSHEEYNKINVKNI